MEELSLDEEIRGAFEKVFDNHLKDPKKTEEVCRIILEVQLIEPNLETILSFIAGQSFGWLNAMYIDKFKRYMNREESFAFIELMRRRAWELREAVMRTRIGEK